MISNHLYACAGGLCYCRQESTNLEELHELHRAEHICFHCSDFMTQGVLHASQRFIVKREDLRLRDARIVAECSLSLRQNTIDDHSQERARNI